MDTAPSRETVLKEALGTRDIIVELVRTHPKLLAALAMFSFYTYLGLQNIVPLTSPSSMPDVTGVATACLVSAGAALAACVVLTALVRKGRLGLPRRTHLVITAVLGALGIAVILAQGHLLGAPLSSGAPLSDGVDPGAPSPGGLADAASTAMLIIGAALMGATSVIWLVDLTCGLAAIGPRKTLVAVVLGYLGNVVLIALFEALPPLAATILAIFAPILLALAAISARPELGSAAGSSELRPAAISRQGQPLRLPPLHRFGLTYAILGLTSGIIAAFMLFGPDDAAGVMSSLVAFVVASVLVIVIAVMVKIDFDRLLFCIGFPLLALGLIATIVLVPDHPLADVPEQVANTFVEVLTWALAAYLVRYEKLPSPWVALRPTCGLFVGHLAGELVGLAVVLADTTPEQLALFLALSVFVILVSALALLGIGTSVAGWGGARPGASEQDVDALGSACERLAAEHSLTPREGEILVYLSRGRTKRFIAEQLCISEDTAKTHIGRIYRKIGVHSQQELLDLVDSTRTTLDNELV